MTTRRGAPGEPRSSSWAPRSRRTHVAAVAAAIAEHGANIDRIRRLSRYPVTTVEIDVSGADVDDLRHALAMVSHRVGVDIAVAPAGLARRGGRLVVMDVDSTLIQDEVIELLAEHAGRAAEVAAVTEARDARRARLRAEPARPGRDAGGPAGDGARRRPGRRAPHPRRPHPGAHPQAARLHRGRRLRRVHRGRRADRRASSASTTCAPTGSRWSTATSPGGCWARSSTAPARRPPCASSPPWRACRSPAPSPSATVPTTSTCSPSPASGSPSTPSRWCASQADTSLTVPYLDAVLFLLGISREEIEDADARRRRATRLTGCRATPRPPPRSSSSVGRRTGSARPPCCAHFLKLAGGRRARLVLIPTASSFQDEVVASYTEVFTRLGAPGVQVVNPATRAESHDPDLVALVDDATGIFMSGGSQLRLSQLLAGHAAGRGAAPRPRPRRRRRRHLGGCLDHEPTS